MSMARSPAGTELEMMLCIVDATVVPKKLPTMIAYIIQPCVAAPPTACAASDAGRSAQYGGLPELVILPILRHAILLEAPDTVAPPVLSCLQRHAGI
jgi:hypothetical protein